MSKRFAGLRVLAATAVPAAGTIAATGARADATKEHVALLARQNGSVAVPPGTRQGTYDNPDHKAAAPFAGFVPAAINSANPSGQTMAGVLTGQDTVDQALASAQSATARTMRQAGYPKQ